MTDYPYGEYKFYIATAYAGSEDSEIINIADYYEEEEWNEMTDLRREAVLRELHEDWMWNWIDAGFEAV